jgi:hypothetical protein
VNIAQVLVNTLTQDNQETLKFLRDVWLITHRGHLREVAEHFGVSRVMVTHVLHGRRRSRDGRIERELARRGVPGFSKAE